MRKLAIWQVAKTTLTRLPETQVELERHLEEWIVDNPNLLQEGLIVVGRQMQLESGPLDLLALDPQGRWVVIEVKRGAIDRKTIAQVVDYAACLAEISADDFRAKVEPFLSSRGLELDELLQDRGAPEALDPDQRHMLLLVVGTGRAAGLERVVRFLSGRHSIPIRVVLFDVFKLDTGQLLLAREVTDQDTSPDAGKDHRQSVSVESVLALAKKHGNGENLQKAVELARKIGIYVRPWKTSLMFTPPANKTRMLFTLWAKPEKGGQKAYIGIEPFAEFFPVSRVEVQKQLGQEGWRILKSAEFTKLLHGIQALVLDASDTDSS